MARSSAPARVATRCPAAASTREGSGTEIAIAAALREAGLSPSESATSMPTASATGLRPGRSPRLRTGSSGPCLPVTALKGYFGNLASGCGAVELIGSLIGVNRGMIPPVLNCDDPDPAWPGRGPRRAAANPQPTFVNTNITARPGGRPGGPGHCSGAPPADYQADL